MVGDVDALAGPLPARRSGRRSSRSWSRSACVLAAALILPAAALVLALGLLVGGLAVPRARATARPRAGRAAVGRARRAHGRARRAAARRARARRYGREEETPRARARRPTPSSRGSAGATRSPPGSPTSLTTLVAGLTAVGVLAVAVAAHDAGSLDRVLVATLALLALASFEAVQPLPAAARELSATLAAGRRVLELIDREPEIRDPAEPLPAPGRRATSRSRT